MRDHEHEIDQADAAVAVIGTGDMPRAEDFAERETVAFLLLVDVDLVSYGAVGARRSTLRGLATPPVLAAGLRALRSGARQGRTGRHPLMLGATHVIGPDGAVPFAWVNAHVGDSAPVADVLEALA